MHHLKTPGKAHYPTRHVAVVCRGHVDKSRSGTACQHEVLERWEAVAWTADGARVIREHRRHGTSHDTFWPGLMPLLQNGGLVWIWCVDAARCLALMGAWGELESGRLRLAGSDPCAPAGPDSGGAPACEGVLVIEDPPTLVQLQIPNWPGTLQIVDVRNYGVTGWDSLLGADSEPDRIAAFVRAMLSELQQRGWGSLKATAASQAWHTWRFKYPNVPVHVHNVKGVLTLERDAYYGGRCEAFRVGEYRDRVWQYDYTSCYPTLCRDHVLPCGLLCYNLEGDCPPAPPACDVAGLIADVTLSTDRPDYPLRVLPGGGGQPQPYPFWRRDPGARVVAETVWPVGEFRVALAGPELEAARAAGHILRWHRWAAYRLAPCLSGFAADLLDARARYRAGGCTALEQWAKALSTSIVGKAGQSATRWVTDPKGHAPEPYCTYMAPGPDGNYVRWRVVAGVPQREEWAPDHPEAVPALAAWVTSLARVRLAGAIAIAGRHAVLYCDTDSLFVTYAGRTALQAAGLASAGAPGELRLKGVEKGMVIHGYKHYVWGKKHVCAGVPVDPERRASGSAGYWYAAGIKDSLQGRRRPAATRALRSFETRAKYRGGEVGEHGIVHPWRFDGRGAAAPEALG